MNICKQDGCDKEIFAGGGYFGYCNKCFFELEFEEDGRIKGKEVRKIEKKEFFKNTVIQCQECNNNFCSEIVNFCPSCGVEYGKE